MCSRCGVEKDIDSFRLPKTSNGKPNVNGVRQSQCRPCNSENAQDWTRRNPERRLTYKRTYDPSYHRARKLMKTYGISLDDYEYMLDRQGGVCAICSQPETVAYGGGEGKFLQVDHCHATGLIRGLLCGCCNRGIGMFDDEMKFLPYAIVYLLNARSRRPRVFIKKKDRARHLCRDAAASRDYKLRRNYNISLADYEEIFREQDGVCAICFRPETISCGSRGTKTLEVDHCHELKIVRGLLCGRCNRGLGFLGDDLSRLLAAIKYLSKDNN